MQNWKCIGSRVLPCQSPPHSNPASAKYCDHCRIHVAGSSLLVGLRIKVDRDAPGMGGELRSRVRCGRNEKQPPKLVILFCESGDLKLVNTSAKTFANNLWQVIALTVCEWSHECQGKRQRDTGKNTGLPSCFERVVVRNMPKMSPNVVQISSSPCGGVSTTGEVRQKVRT